jgi:acyl-CoA synthetase (AMP-forming)/AMP-acid ligase II
MNVNISKLTSRHAKYRPDHLAVVFQDKRLTYGAFNKGVNRLAHALLEKGIRKGDKVATILPNCLELLEVYWAVAKMGAVVVPLSTLLLGKGLKSLLVDADTKMIITYSGFVSTLEEIRPELKDISSDRFIIIDASNRSGYQDYHALKEKADDSDPEGIEIEDDDYYNIIYSSGTTGEPKGIVHTHFIRGMYCTLIGMALRMTPESITLHTGSMVFNGAFATLLPTFFLGATYILHKQFDIETFIEAVEKEKVTHVMMVPAQIIAIINSPTFSSEALGSLEAICSVGAPLHKEHKDKLLRYLPGRFYEIYGLTEGFVTILDNKDFMKKPDSVGVPTSLFEMRIVDDHGNEVLTGETGEIVGRCPLLMPEYYKRPDLTNEAIRDGWLYTGDMGYVDEDGFLYLVDRKKDMIISGGVNVYPRDIEEIVVQHPAVLETAVFGVPSEKWGETPVAAVTVRQGNEVNPEELKGWINEQVGAKFQRVSHVIIMNDFPRNVAGKTLKRVIREDFLKGTSPDRRHNL